jgi:hypothetical protein
MDRYLCRRGKGPFVPPLIDLRHGTIECFVIGQRAAQAQEGFQASHAQSLPFYNDFDSVPFTQFQQAE